ncbi:transmembrane protein 179B-like isoform X2 [Heptranchias perlo]|uniref:transmembrane protein 179B-like isoform X2 n=1 Tax=Heptranchias perlo TaxID=212740 RepID=UPI00355A2878
MICGLNPVTGSDSTWFMSPHMQKVKGEFGSGCILYGKAQWNDSTKSLMLVHFGSSSHCSFVNTISVAIAIYCFCIIFYFICASCLDEARRGLHWLTASLVVSSIYLLLLLASGCLIRVGLNAFCQSILLENGIKSCSEAETKNWMPPYGSCRFYRNFSNAETSIWVNFFLWMVVLALLLVQRKMGNPESGGGGASETDHLAPLCSPHRRTFRRGGKRWRRWKH